MRPVRWLGWAGLLIGALLIAAMGAAVVLTGLGVALVNFAKPPFDGTSTRTCLVAGSVRLSALRSEDGGLRELDLLPVRSGCGMATALGDVRISTGGADPMLPRLSILAHTTPDGACVLTSRQIALAAARLDQASRAQALPAHERELADRLAEELSAMDAGDFRAGEAGADGLSFFELVQGGSSGSRF